MLPNLEAIRFVNSRLGHSISKKLRMARPRRPQPPIFHPLEPQNAAPKALALMARASQALLSENRKIRPQIPPFPPLKQACICEP